MAEDGPTLEQLYQANAPGLLAFLYARLGDHAWAEDILHDVFLAYLRQAGSEIRSPKSYLYRSAHRASLNALRDRATADRAHRQLAASWRARDGADPALADALREALDRLPDDDRQVLVLRAYGGMTFQEITDVLGFSLTTVFRMHQRGLTEMRQALNGSLVAQRRLCP